MSKGLFSFHRDTVDKYRLEHISEGDVDGFLAAEVSARLFDAAPHVIVSICHVEHFEDRTPFRLISVMPGAWQSDMKLTASVANAALREIRESVAVELLPTTVV